MIFLLFVILFLIANARIGRIMTHEELRRDFRATGLLGIFVSLCAAGWWVAKMVTAGEFLWW